MSDNQEASPNGHASEPGDDLQPSAAAGNGNGNGGAPAPARTGEPVLTSARAGRSWLRWTLAAIVVAVGALASVLGAKSVAHSSNPGARAQFKRGAAATLATVKVGLAHQEDLATGAGTYFSRNSEGSSAEFKAWALWARILRSHPELDSLSLVSLVRTPELAAFRARRAGLPASATVSKPVPGGRSYECLSAGTVSRGLAAEPPASFDYCSAAAGLLTTRRTSHSRYGSTTTSRGAALEVFIPAYRGSTVPKSAFGRRAAFVGWLREVLEPRVLLTQALAGDTSGAARLRHIGGGANTVFTAGTPAHGAQSSVSTLPGGWTLKSFGPPLATAGLFDDGDALAVLILGLLAGLLAGALVAFAGRHGGSAAPSPQTVGKTPPSEDLYDALTGLPNRGLTLDRAERMLARAGRNSAIMVGALFIDIDWFKDLNDKLGEEAGDQILKIVAERLQDVVRTHDTVGRYSGDEFVVIVESQVKGMRLDSLARRIIESLHKPVDIEGFGPSFCLTASIGVAFGRYATPEDLLRDAHMALFAAKAAGKDRYTLFNANMRSIIEGRGVLEVDLNTALQDGQFSLLYQPVFDLRDRRVVALESLLRWVHPTRGEVDPSDFIPLAEESGLIVPIGRWVLEEACTRAAAWNVAGHRVGIAVKVSPKQLSRDGFATDVLRALQQSGLDPSLLALEIAETTVMEDKTEAARRLEGLKGLGVKIAIDDFGSGYAYRSDLQRMPIDFLKVDRGSLAASEDEDYRSWLLEAILVFGRDLSLTVIAKGVESQEQAAALQSMGCTMAQGFYLGEPVDPDGIEGLLSLPPLAGSFEPGSRVAESQ
ncbi:MAG TPA: bifunctional diguanylate cyclase/phosphodiesterase [Solirubrobacteraceae bacterium]|jgi:diguanylate cyclase (GGDEF)-like protein|nr:bifunctional diguanylate cyclase/phosphodiesterase [Solirubrobacteraceae bacterium]